jgi:hypothetical protein
MSAVLSTFGQASEAYFVSEYTIPVWNKHLFADMR